MTDFPSRKQKLSGVLIDSNTANARLGAAAAVNSPGIVGNRWISFGGDGTFPAKYIGKIKHAVHLAYELKDRKAYIDRFNAVLRETAILKPLSFVEALDIAQLNYAETTTNSIARKEIDKFYKEAKEARALGFKPEGGFTSPLTSQIYIYKHALNWNVKILAGLICHEVAHVAGCNAGAAEFLLLGPEAHGYPRGPK